MQLKIQKNTEPAPNMGSRFGQDVEPHGTYVTRQTSNFLPNKWVQGNANLNNPLIINITDDTNISYKYDLAKHFKAKGKNLTKKLMDRGYDSIVTQYPNGSTGEIVLFPNADFMLQESKSLIKKLLRESLLPESVKGGVYHVYHASDTNFTNFSDEFVGGEKAVDANGPGIYFSDSEEDAGHFGVNMYKVTLTPNILFDETPPSKKIIPILTKLVKMAPDWKGSAQNYHENPNIGLTNFVNDTLKYNSSEKDCLLQVWVEFYRYYPIEFVRNCVKLGVDGIKVANKFVGGETTHFIIYNPNIIKNK